MRAAKTGMMAAMTLLAATKAAMTTSGMVARTMSRTAMRGETMSAAMSRTTMRSSGVGVMASAAKPWMTTATRCAAVIVTPASGTPVASTMGRASVFMAAHAGLLSTRSARPTRTVSQRAPIASTT